MESKTKTRNRLRLLEASLLLFQNPGYYQTDIRRIAKEAGLGLGTFYNYYSSKLDLYLDVYSRAHNKLFEDFIDLVHHHGDKLHDRPLASIREFLEFQFQSHVHDPRFYIEAELLCLSESRVKQLKEELDREAIRQLEAFMYESEFQSEKLSISIELIYQITEDFIHRIAGCNEKKKELYLDELTKIIHGYFYSIPS